MHYTTPVLWIVLLILRFSPCSPRRMGFFIILWRCHQLSHTYSIYVFSIDFVIHPQILQRLKILTPRQTDLNLDQLVDKFRERKKQHQEVEFRTRYEQQEKLRQFQQEERMKELERAAQGRQRQTELVARIRWDSHFLYSICPCLLDCNIGSLDLKENCIFPGFSFKCIQLIS